jgi:hypothetical protein
VIQFNTESTPVDLTVTFAVGQDFPAGDLYATATSRGTVLTLDPIDITGSDEVAAVQVTIDPNDFESYGSRVWAVEVGTLDEVSGDDATAYVMFAGSVAFREMLSGVIASTTIEELGSS